MNALRLATMNDVMATETGTLLTDSMRVAEHFGRRHKNVLQAIQRLDCSPEFHRLNFQPMIRRVKVGKNAEVDQTFYTMTKDGFMFLVMGFTGPQAAAIKESFITAFNQMAEALSCTMRQFNLECHRYAVAESIASRCGKGLRNWRDEKPRRKRRLEAMHPQMRLLIPGKSAA